MNQPIDIRPDHAEIVQDILATRLPETTSVWVFGSRAKWTAKTHSDLDLAIKGKERLPFSVLSDLAEAFSESDLPFKVDVVDWHAISPALRAVVDRDGLSLSWPLLPLSHFVDPDRAICYGIVQPGEAVKEGVPIIRVNNFGPGGIDVSDALRVAPSIEAKYARSRLRGGELLVTLVGSVGQSAIAPAELKGWNVARAVGVIPIKDTLRTRWIKFVLASTQAQDFLHQRANTTVQTTINLRDLSELPIPTPPRPAMEGIVGLLGALDDKIELNRRMNETLEAMARAIFKDWFVDFGPTRAKMEGRAPYLAPDIWSLFPDRLDEDGKPEGWQHCRLLDLCELKRGYDLPIAKREEGSVPIISSSGLSGTHNRSMAAAPGVVTGRYGTIGEVFYIEDDFWPLNTALYVCNFKISEPRFIFYLLKSIDFRIYSDKAAVPGINRNHLHEHIVIKPSPDVERQFAAILEPLWRRQRLNELENASLAKTRDLLLPKLMSGEIRVRDAENPVEEMT